MLTLDRLRNALDYNAESGIFVRKIRTARYVHVGDVAGWQTQEGYIIITLDGERYAAHRLAWFYMTCEWPTDQIDHINMAKNDNRWCNLREATRSQNKANIRALITNTSGVKGVSRHGNGWRASATVAGKFYNLPTRKSIELAVIDYEIFVRAHHGAFARTS